MTIQIDGFFSFAVGATVGTLAGVRLKKEDSLIVSRYFVFTVCYLSMIVSPIAVYMLWQNTGWETMFFFGFDDLHGLFPCLFSCTNVLLGVFGFVLCARLVRRNKETTAHACWTTSYTCMFAIITFGYDRFLYTGTLDEWRQGVKYHLSDFLTSQVFYTLLVMTVFVLPPHYFAMWKWSSEPHMDQQGRVGLLGIAVLQYIRVSGLIISTYLLLLFMPKLFTQLSILPVHWNVDRLFAFILGQSVFGALILLPIYLVKVRDSKRQTKSD